MGYGTLHTQPEPGQEESPSKLTNCLLMPRHDLNEPMFIHENGRTLAHLDGYAIIPVKEYERLKKLEERNKQTFTPPRYF